MKKILLVSFSVIFIIGNCFSAVLEKTKQPGIPASVKKVRSFVDKMKMVDKNSKKSAMPKKTVSFTEKELQEYFNFTSEERKKKVEIENIKIGFATENTFTSQADVKIDLNEVFKQQESSVVGKILKKAAGLKNSFFLQGRISSAKGKGIILVQIVKINGIKLPDTLVQALINHIGKKQKPPLDLTKFVDLPYGIQKIEVSPGIITIKM